MTQTKPHKSSLKAIRAYCLGCASGSSKTVRNCAITDCPLHFYRFGKNPKHHAGTFTAEQIKAGADRLRKSTETKNTNVETQEN